MPAPFIVTVFESSTFSSLRPRTPTTYSTPCFKLSRYALRACSGVVTVRFASDGSERRLMLDYAPLEKL